MTTDKEKAALLAGIGGFGDYYNERPDSATIFLNCQRVADIMPRLRGKIEKDTGKAILFWLQIFFEASQREKDGSCHG